MTIGQLGAALDRVSDDVKRAVATRGERAAVLVQAEAAAAYPIGPPHRRRGRVVGGGVLRRSVRKDPARAVVRVTAPHVHFYEDGTRERRDPTRGNASRGRMPARGPIFVEAAVAARTSWLRDAVALISRTVEL